MDGPVPLCSGLLGGSSFNLYLEGKNKLEKATTSGVFFFFLIGKEVGGGGFYRTFASASAHKDGEEGRGKHSWPWRHGLPASQDRSLQLLLFTLLPQKHWYPPEIV
jgi:hypothetical protein